MTGTARTRSCVAIIPARGGSERIPRKNLIPIAGKPLVAHTIAHATAAALVDEVWVSTDDEEIAAVARAGGARCVRRPEHLANATATSEAALIHALDERLREGLHDPDAVLFLQCTSPVRRPDDIDRAIEMFWSGGWDSVMSVTETTRFIWARRNGEAVSLNYDYRRRQREQDLDRQYQENGSLYLCRPDRLRRDNNRLGGRIGFFEMDYWASFQIDSPEDARLCGWILSQPGYGSSGE